MSDAGWRTSNLSDLVEEAIGGLWGSAPDSGKQDEADVLVVRGADFRDWNNRRALDAAPRRVPIRSLAHRALEPGDLVLEVSGGSPAQPVGRVVVIDELAVSGVALPLICSNFCRKLRLKPGVDPFFIKRQLDWFYQSGHTDRFQTSTTNIRNLQVTDFLVGTQIVLPAEDVQRQLTAILDAIESKRASSARHLVAARHTIERFRQAVLAAACAGRLTADWRETAKEAPGKALVDEIDSLRNRRFRQPAAGWEFEVPDTWELVSLDRLTTLITSGSRGWAKYYSQDGPRFIRAQNISTDRLVLQDMAHVRPPKGSEGELTQVQQADLLVTITGANVTKSAFVDRDIGEAYVNQHVALIRPVIPELVDYLHLWTISPQHGRKKLSADAYGAGKPGLNLHNLRTMPVGLPPIEEQVEIVARTKALFALADRIQGRVATAIRQLDRSSQAVLAKAFRGEMVTDSKVALATEKA